MRPDVPSLRDARLVREVERSFACVLDRKDFRLVHYSIQSNHLHLIAEAKDMGALGRGMNALGARLARAVNRVFGRKGRVLLERFHHVVLRYAIVAANHLVPVARDGRDLAAACASIQSEREREVIPIQKLQLREVRGQRIGAGAFVNISEQD